jgi:nicotinate-nucleotide adenylyltransferase
LCLLLGLDAYRGLPLWDRWPELFDLAHIVVARRPGDAKPLTGEIAAAHAERVVGTARELGSARSGRVLEVEVTQLDISATAIRRIVAAGGDPRFLVPDAVRELIRKTHIYALPREVRTRAQ